MDDINWKEKYLYLAADFDNYKKRIAKEQNYKNKGILLNIINVVDDIERSFGDKELQESAFVNILYKSLKSILVKEGVNSIEIKVGDTFSEKTMNAVSVINGEVKNGTVVSICKKGYTYKDTIIRYADVIVD